MGGEIIYYGLNALSHNIIIANRKKFKNPNGLFLGVPGSGENFAAKRELVSVFLATNDKTPTADAMSGYSVLTGRFEGQVVEIAPGSPNHINPVSLTADLDSGEENSVALKVDLILSLMELIVGSKNGL